MGIDKELTKQGYEYDDRESGWRGEIMNIETQKSEMVLLNQVSKEELAKVVVELIKNDREVQRAILDLAFSCPNIVTQI